MKSGKARSLLAVLLALIMCLFTAMILTGCSGSELSNETAEVVDEAEDAAEDFADATESSAEDVVAGAKESEEIGEDKALEIALEDAGLKESEVKVIKTKLDNDDGRAEYEIKFRKDRIEYEYSIDAYSGGIIEKDVEEDDD